MSVLSEILSAPGEYARGALALRPGERLGGREMLESLGVLGANTEGLDPGDIAGFLAEVILDPWNLVPFGAMMKGGKSLAKAAMAAGPRWKHGAKLIEGADDLVHAVGNLDALSYLPPGSRPIGNGAEAVVFGTPQGRALRFGRDIDDLLDPLPRYAVDPVLPSSHSVIMPYKASAAEAAERGGAIPGTIIENMEQVVPLDRFLQKVADQRLLRYRAGQIPEVRLDYLRRRHALRPGEIDYIWNYHGRDRDALNMIPHQYGTPLPEWAPRDAVEMGILDDVYRTSGNRRMYRLADRASDHGVGWGDTHLANAGVRGHHAVIMDPGFMSSYATSQGFPENISRNVATDHVPLSRFEGFLADKLGYTNMVRRQWEGLPWRDPTLRNAIALGLAPGFGDAVGNIGKSH